MTTLGVTLPSHVRGDTFEYSTELEDGWTFAQFTGGIRFTLRQRYPASSVVTDADVVDQASTVAGEIVAGAEPETVAITIPAERTTDWPAGKLVFDLQGVIAGATPRVYTIASGVITILPDVTRST
jgi:hypothetical protein